MSAGRIARVVSGAVLALVGLGLIIGAGALAVAQTQRHDGFFTTSDHHFQSAAHAITSEKVDLGSDPEPGDWLGDKLFERTRVRLVLDPAGPADELFVGIGPADEVAGYLADVAHDQVRDLRLRPFRVAYTYHAGTTEPDPPTAQPFWVASSVGPGRQRLEWTPEAGEWTVVVMNADATRGVAADVDIGVKVTFLGPLMIGLLAAGVVLVGLGVLLITLGGHRRRAAATAPPTTTVAPGGVAPLATRSTAAHSAAESYPLRLQATLDEHLSPWLWLVKWLLAIPHLIVLGVLWVVFMVLTLVAGIMILITGRYPRPLFDLNTGILRWSWRVGYYAFAVLGTDRYPPFSLGRRGHYPAQLDIEYPERLSRGLVLVKWWLLAIPHYIVVGLLAGGGGWVGWRSSDGGSAAGGGFSLIGILTLVAAVSLLFRRHYPPALFDLLMGCTRWVFRVIAYAALMTDRYPPFRLDLGGDDPVAPGPTPPADDADDATDAARTLAVAGVG